MYGTLAGGSERPKVYSRASEDCGHHAGVAPSVHHGDNPQRLFFRRVGNQIFTHRNEAEGPSGEVGALVADIGKMEPRRDHGVKDFLTHTVGRQAGLSSAMYSQISVISCAASG